MSPPFPLKTRAFSKLIVLLVTCFTLVSCLAYFVILKMEAKYYSETSVGIQGARRRYVLDNGILHSHGYEKLEIQLLLLWAEIYGAPHIDIKQNEVHKFEGRNRRTESDCRAQ
jgi:hypothetical protein